MGLQQQRVVAGGSGVLRLGRAVATRLLRKLVVGVRQYGGHQRQHVGRVRQLRLQRLRHGRRVLASRAGRDAHRATHSRVRMRALHIRLYMRDGVDNWLRMCIAYIRLRLLGFHVWLHRHLDIRPRRRD